MNNRSVIFFFVFFVVFAVRGQQTTDVLIERIVKLAPRSIEKYVPRPKRNVLLLQTAFNDAVYKDPQLLQALKGKVILKVELVYTTYRKSETFDQHGLNRKRLRALMAAAPQLLSQPSIEWILLAQTGCTSAEMGKEFFHGVAITYREPETEALRDTELEFLEAVAAGTVPAYAYDAYIKNALKTPEEEPSADTSTAPVKIRMPEFKGGERARVDFFSRNLKYPSTANKSPSERVTVQFQVDKEGKVLNITLPGTSNPTPYHEEVLRFMRTMPEWSPGTVNGKRIDCMVQFTIDFLERGSIIPSPLEVYAMDAAIPETAAPKLDYSRINPTPQSKFVSETLAKNHWKQAALVCDVTASMAPYSAQVLEFLRNELNKKDTAIVRFLFFNDGNNRKDNSKKIGSVGGIYAIQTRDFDAVLQTLSQAMKAGTGGDLEENNIEALLQAEKECPSCTSTILVADNMASPRDMTLVPQLQKPVHVIVCGFSPILNADYMNLARATKGTLHFNNRDYTNLHTFTEDGATVQVGKEVYILKKGRFERKP